MSLMMSQVSNRRKKKMRGLNSEQMLTSLESSRMQGVQGQKEKENSVYASHEKELWDVNAREGIGISEAAY